MNWDFGFIQEYRTEFIDGFFLTLKVSMAALILSLIIGTIIAIFRISSNKALRAFGTSYVEFFRNTPLMVQVFFFYFGLASIGYKLTEFWIGALALSIYTAAFIAEIIRAGIQTVPHGQTEAARASGLSFLQTMFYVVLPQAFKLVIPPMCNQFINLVKNSSILSVIAAQDILYVGEQAIAEYDPFSVEIFVAALYLIITIPLSQGVNLLERRWAKQGTR
ncbi:amino acid ABC transporter permease [Baia soyae]|uniref:Amino acid ABC transporter membrane protein 1 (PAAT family) n=1 Tax=Baia soyae TaxID=1544746 RepID=A0A4R2RQT6_9BACL|nr:amino acid ABC transporter permease [Baia soyae]TCP66532.1 amino acid ABC transporter membrane protein 1 (PAAT family) [Baia soyae]